RCGALAGAVAAMGAHAAPGGTRSAKAALALAAERAGAADLLAARDCRARPLQARSSRAQIAAEPAGGAARAARGGRAAFSCVAGAWDSSRGAGRDRPRDDGGAERSRLRRVVGR